MNAPTPSLDPVAGPAPGSASGTFPAQPEQLPAQRFPVRPRRWPRVLALFVVVVVLLALVAATFVLSYDGVRSVAVSAGVSASLARFYPGVLDAALLIACAAALLLRDGKWWARWYAWIAVIVIVAVAGGTDAVHAMNVALPRRQTAGVVAAAPWVLVLLAFSLWITILRQSRGAHRPAQPPVSPSAAFTAAPAAADPAVTAPAVTAHALLASAAAVPAEAAPAPAAPAPVTEAEPGADAEPATQPVAAITEPVIAPTGLQPVTQSVAAAAEPELVSEPAASSTEHEPVTDTGQENLEPAPARTSEQAVPLSAVPMSAAPASAAPASAVAALTLPAPVTLPPTSAETATSETTAPDTPAPEILAPEAATPETLTPEASTPEADVPHAAAFQAAPTAGEDRDEAPQTLDTEVPEAEPAPGMVAADQVTEGQAEPVAAEDDAGVAEQTAIAEEHSAVNEQPAVIEEPAVAEERRVTEEPEAQELEPLATHRTPLGAEPRTRRLDYWDVEDEAGPGSLADPGSPTEVDHSPDPATRFSRVRSTPVPPEEPEEDEDENENL